MFLFLHGVIRLFMSLLVLHSPVALSTELSSFTYLTTLCVMCVVLINFHRDIFSHGLDFEISNWAPGTETLREQYKFRIS